MYAVGKILDAEWTGGKAQDLELVKDGLGTFAEAQFWVDKNCDSETHYEIRKILDKNDSREIYYVGED